MSATTIPNGRLKITTPLTYRFNGGSFFTDLLAASRSDTGALERLDRHEREMRDQLPQLEVRGSAGQPEGVSFEYRAPNGSFPTGSTTGQGGSFTPPLWMVEAEATYPRPERVVADLIDPMPLPAGVSSVNVPILTTGTSTGAMAPNQPTPDTDVTDSATTSPVQLIAGREDVPLQMLEQSPQGAWELTLLKDLWSDYDAKLEGLLLNGTGGTAPFGQILGLLNVSGINSVTYTNATPSGTGMYSSFGEAFAQVSDNRRIRPEGFLMRGRRFGWLACSEDQASRPLDTPASAHSLIVDPSKPTPVGSLVGLPVFTDEEIPTTFGAGGDQDTVIAFRWSDCLGWESAPTVNVFTQAVSGNLMARVQYRRYAAAILGRYPTGIAAISGTGMVVPS